jgi:5'-3' exonuclease/transcription antitermination factor NusG
MAPRVRGVVEFFAGGTVSEWVVLELSPKAENEDPEIVRSSIRHLLRDAEIFIPASIVEQGDDRLVKYLIDGYAFIKRTHPDDRYFRLEGSKYIQTIVTAPTMGSRSRRLACVQDADIEKFRRQIKTQEDQGIDVGDLVMITSGPYKNLKAFVIEDIPENDAVQVHVQLRSKDSLVSLPRAFLRLQEKAPKPPYYERMVALRAQVDAALVLAKWEPAPQLGPTFHEWFKLNRVIEAAQQVMVLSNPLDGQTLKVKGEEYASIVRWIEGVRSLFVPLGNIAVPLDPGPLGVGLTQYTQMTRWANRTNSLAAIVFSLYSGFPSADLQAKYVEWLWLYDLHDRLLSALTHIERIENQMTSGGTQNLIIDGHNLAVRCATAPGLGELKDSKGRPTGAIVGFLNSLGSLKKRFPGVNVYVTWDGSSQRRKALFAGYKDGRGNPRAAFETTWLQAALPAFGVYQAWNTVEEADDAIATLVRGPLAGQSNVIFSTDRDLLQLVTPSTNQLIPAVGAGKEKLMGPAEVEAEYGVPPSMMPQLRALSGDTSDTIPGCPNCGLKTAAKLVKLYGTIEKLLASNMAGLAKGLTANLRASESQIRLNVKLMTLVTDLSLTMLDPDEDEKAACDQLQDVDVKPERLLSAFFGSPAAA